MLLSLPLLLLSFLLPLICLPIDVLLCFTIIVEGAVIVVKKYFYHAVGIMHSCSQLKFHNYFFITILLGHAYCHMTLIMKSMISRKALKCVKLLFQLWFFWQALLRWLLTSWFWKFIFCFSNSNILSFFFESLIEIPYLYSSQITSSLEQRCYRDLRNEHFHSVKVVLSIYRKLLITCKDQMWVFSPFLFVSVLSQGTFLCQIPERN